MEQNKKMDIKINFIYKEWGMVIECHYLCTFILT